MAFLGVAEAAKVAGVSEASIYLWQTQKKIVGAQHEGRRAIDAESLTAFLATRVPPKGGPPRGPRKPRADAATGKPSAADKKGRKAKAKAKAKANGAAAPDAAGAGAPPDDMITAGEAAVLAGVSSSNVYAWIAAKKIRSKKVGTSRLIPREPFERFLSTYRRHGKYGKIVPAVAPPAPPVALGGALLTTDEAAAMARVAVHTLYRWFAEKRFASARQPGGRRMIDRASFEAFLRTYPGNPKARKNDVTPQGQLPFSAVRQLARGEERAAEFGGQVPRADHLASLDMAQQIGSELGSALSNYRKHVLRKFLEEQLAKLDVEP